MIWARLMRAGRDGCGSPSRVVLTFAGVLMGLIIGLFAPSAPGALAPVAGGSSGECQTAAFAYDRSGCGYDGLSPVVRAVRTPIDAIGVRAALPRLAAKAVGRLDPAEIRFSQDSISATFRNGRGSIDELAEGLRSGRIDPSDVPAVRLVKRDGQLFTLDNRRLEAFRRAGVDIPYRMATPEEIAAEAYKFTTRNGGTSIRVRGG